MAIVPKKLHAIWLGKVLREAGRKNIEAWTKINPDYEMNVWIDSSTYKNKSLEHISCYKNFKTWASVYGIVINDINPKSEDPDLGTKAEIFEGMKSQRFYLSECRDPKDPAANFAAASDILRAEILFKIGGVYVDAEDLFPVEQLNTLEVSDEEGILIPLLMLNGICRINNDLIASIPYGKDISTYRDDIFNNYVELYIKDPRYLLAHHYQHLASFRTKHQDKRLSTMALSGPKVYNNITENVMFPQKYWKRPEIQAASWLKIDMNDYELFAKNFRLNVLEYFNLLLENYPLSTGFKFATTVESTNIALTQLIKLVKQFSKEVKQENFINEDLLKTIEDYANEAEKFLLYYKHTNSSVSNWWIFFEKHKGYNETHSFKQNLSQQGNLLYFFHQQLPLGFFECEKYIQKFQNFYSYQDKTQLLNLVEEYLKEFNKIGLPFLDSNNYRNYFVEDCQKKKSISHSNNADEIPKTKNKTAAKDFTLNNTKGFTLYNAGFERSLTDINTTKASSITIMNEHLNDLNDNSKSDIKDLLKKYKPEIEEILFTYSREIDAVKKLYASIETDNEIIAHCESILTKECYLILKKIYKSHKNNQSSLPIESNKIECFQLDSNLVSPNTKSIQLCSFFPVTKEENESYKYNEGRPEFRRK